MRKSKFMPEEILQVLRQTESGTTKAQELGGFDFNVHHQYDPFGRVLYLGDGTTRVAEAITPVITHVGGAGQGNFPTGDNGPATKAQLVYQAIRGLALLPDGQILVPNYGYLRSIGTDGIIRRWAGWARPTTENRFGHEIVWNADGTVVGEGGLKDSTYLRQPQEPVLGADGTVYLADNYIGGRRLVRITPSGMLSRIAGQRAGGGVALAEGVRSRDVTLPGVTALAIDATNNLYFVTEIEPQKVYRLGADSIFHVFAGTGVFGAFTEGAAAATSRLANVTSLAVGPDGSVYLGLDDPYQASFRRVARVTPDGVIRTYVGGGTKQASVAAQRLELTVTSGVKRVAVTSHGDVYFNDGNQVLLATQDGALRRIAGVSPFETGSSGDGGPALRAKLNGISALALAPDGALLIGDFGNGKVRKVAASLPGFTGGGVHYRECGWE